jgi:hypothetical protein
MGRIKKLGLRKYGNEAMFESTSNVLHKTGNGIMDSHSRVARYYAPGLEQTLKMDLSVGLH